MFTAKLSLLGLNKGTNSAENLSRYSGIASNLKHFNLLKVTPHCWVPTLKWWSRFLKWKEDGQLNAHLDSKNISIAWTSAGSYTLTKLARFCSTFRILRTQSSNRESWVKSWHPKKWFQVTQSFLLQQLLGKPESKHLRGQSWVLDQTSSLWKP